jgi:toxin-antitoxin system PIN domain toxin
VSSPLRWYEGWNTKPICKTPDCFPKSEFMRVLFDVNALIALVDQQHIHHNAVHEWWAPNRSAGWATCPLTENGLARIMSQPGYKNPVTANFAIDLLAEQMGETDHAFWPDDISLRDVTLFDAGSILGPNQITDVYLLALAVSNEGCVATLDRSIPLRAVRGAEPRHLVVI